MEKPVILKRRLMAQSIRMKFAPRSVSTNSLKNLSFKLSSELTGGYWDKTEQSESTDKFKIPESLQVDKSFFKRKDPVISYIDHCCKQINAFDRRSIDFIRKKVLRKKL